MIHIDGKSVIETRIAESIWFDKYKKIMDRVRWEYYTLFEDVKNSRPSFEYII